MVSIFRALLIIYQPSKVKNLKTDRKKGVPFKMMFRNHMDPDYYDPKANDKIFVPDVSSSAITDKQKVIIESFPERDRGIFKEGQENSTNLIEEDPLEAVVKKMKIKRKEKIKEKQKKAILEGDFTLKEDQEDEEDEDSDIIDDSDEDEYYDDEDSEDEEESKENYTEEVKGVKIKIDDANQEVKKIQKMKPAEGVKFTQYDEYGLPKDDGFNYQQFIVTDDLRPTDMYIPAPPEMVERMMTKVGYHRDVDKEISQMTEDEKAVYLCMTDDIGEYDELEDDFLFLANEGKPAIVQVEEEVKIDAKSKKEDNTPEFANKGVVIVRDEEEEKLKAMREKYKKQLGLGKPKPEEEESDDGEEEEEEYDEENDNGDEDIEKKDFQDILDNDYADDQIGDVQDVEQEDLISKELLDEALEEFIESQKLRDRKLYKEFKGDDKPDELIPRLKTKAQMDAEERETEEEKEELRKKAMALAEILEKEMEDRGSDYTEEDPYDHYESDQEEKWDCNTILTTFTNKDNHPGIIKTTRVVKQKGKIELHKQLRVPIDGLMAEEILITKKKDRVAKKSAKTPYTQVDEEIESESDSENEKDDDKKSNEDNDPSDPKDMKKLRKQQGKAEKREKRKLKKELKIAFKSQNTRLVKATTTDIGQIKSGVSIKKIY